MPSTSSQFVSISRRCRGFIPLHELDESGALCSRSDSRVFFGGGRKLECQPTSDNVGTEVDSDEY